MIPRTLEECQIADASSEYACIMPDALRRKQDEAIATSYDPVLESFEQKAFDQWHNLGPESARY